jgi:YYY domain-containing protein
MAIFIIWCAIRSTNAQIEGTEKFMNLAFMNVLNRAEYLPPLDPWFSGGTVNYYYLGHYLFTFVGKAGNIAMSYAYNLAMVTIISFAFIGSFSIINQLLDFKKKKWSIIAGLMGAGLLCFGSNLHYLYQWVSALFARQEFSYWFPDGTRIIPNVIDEFPAYSITLADLHGHYLGFPFVIVFIALAFVSWKIGITTVKKMKFNLLISIFLFSLYGINTWDFITINALFIILHAYQAITAKVKLKEKLFCFFTSEITLIIPGLLFMLPYFFNFQPAIGGIGLVPFNTPRSLSAWLLMWGAFLIISIVSLITIILVHRFKIGTSPKGSGKASWKTTWQGLWQGLKDAVNGNSNLIFALVLNLLVAGLIIGVEVFFIKDIFEKDNGIYFRANTVFKFYFSAWTIWSVLIAYYAGKTLQKIFETPIKRYGFILFGVNVVVILIVFIGTVSYIFEAVNDFYKFGKYEDGTNIKVAKIFENKQKIVFYETLDGNDYIRKSHTEDYLAIDWINKNIKGQPIIAEAVGEAYTYFSRISANTGLITPIGWPTHEWQWRDNTTEIFKRKDEIEKLYTTANIDELMEIINKYQIKYIFVGEKEREYKTLNETLFKDYLEVAFTSGQTTIYKVN